MKKTIAAILLTAVLFLAPTCTTSAHAEDANDTTFTIVWISDTQSMVNYYPTGALESMGKWIIDHKEIDNIVQVVQTGDAVEDGDQPYQWDNYHKLTNQFSGDIPYLQVAGNHEKGVKPGTYSWRYYLTQPEIMSTPDEQKFQGGKSLYSTFEVGGEKFIIMGIGYGAERASAEWVNAVLAEYAEYTAIIATHSYIRAGGEYMPEGEYLFENVVTCNPNVRLILCGHVSPCGTAYRAELIDGRTVNAMMYNYQAWGSDCGQLRTLTFNTADRSITVHTFSPYTGKEYVDVTFGTATFVLENAF